MSILNISPQHKAGLAWWRRHSSAGVLGLFVVATACTSDVQAPAPPLQRDFLTGAAALALQSDGHFAMPNNVVNPIGEVSRAQAVEITRRYLLDVGHSLIGAWSTNFGSPIALADLAPCKQPLYAAGPYASISGNMSEGAARMLGPHWVVPICVDGGRIAVVLSFSAQATDLVVPTGVNPPYETGDMLSFGVPATSDVSLYEPEAAAALAYASTGRRVTEVPLLVMNPRPEVPQLVRWRVQLEAPVLLEGHTSAASRSRSALLVGFASVFRISGLLDIDPAAPVPMASIHDGGTKSTLQTQLSPLAPAPVEVVTARQP